METKLYHCRHDAGTIGLWPKEKCTMTMRNSVILPVFVLNFPEYGRRSQWGEAVVKEKVEGALERWGLKEIQFDNVPAKSRYEVEKDCPKCSIAHRVYNWGREDAHPWAGFRVPTDPVAREKFDEDFGPIELISGRVEPEGKKLLKGFEAPVINWRPTTNIRGGVTEEETPDSPGDGQFADGTPFWWSSWQGNSLRYHPGLVSTRGGKDVFASFRPVDARVPEWWLSTVAPDFWNYEMEQLSANLQLTKLPVARVKLLRRPERKMDVFWSIPVAAVYAAGNSKNEVRSRLAPSDLRTFAGALVDEVPFLHIEDLPSGESKTVGEAVAEVTPQAAEGDILEVYAKGGAWHAFTFVRKDGEWKSCHFYPDKPEPVSTFKSTIEDSKASFWDVNEFLKIFGIETNLKGWREATREDLESARARVQTRYDAAFEEFVVRQHYFPRQHEEVERWRLVLQAIDEKLEALASKEVSTTE